MFNKCDLNKRLKKVSIRITSFSFRGHSKRLPFTALLLTPALLAIPSVSFANEGGYFLYLFLAPFALLSTPYFLTGTCIVIVIYSLLRYRTTRNRSRLLVALLAVILAIPAGIRDSRSYAVLKAERERRVEMDKRWSEARRAGKYPTPDFKAMSAAHAAKYQASAKTEADRRNLAAGMEMVRMGRTLDATMQKENPPPPVEEEKPPARSSKTFLFELLAAILLLGAGFAGAVIDRWRRRRDITDLLHLAPLFFLIFVPLLSQLPLMDMLYGPGAKPFHISRFTRFALYQPSYLLAYLAGVAIFSYLFWRGKESGGNAPPEPEPAGETPQDVAPPSSAPLAEFTHFTCPGCGLAGKIATERLAGRAVTATCPSCATRFPVRPAETAPVAEAPEKAHAAVSANPAGEAAEPGAASVSKRRLTFSWKKAVLACAALCVFTWVAQTFLLNSLIVLGSNAGARFTLLSPLALLPFTVPTSVRFVDGTTGKPLSGKRVLVSWEYNRMGILPDKEARYSERVLTTDEQGKILVPSRLKPAPTYLLAFYHSFNQGIFLFPEDPAYLSPRKEQRIQGLTFTETVSLTPCRTPQDWESALGLSYLFPYKYLREGVDRIAAANVLPAYDDNSLQQLCDRCDALVTPASRQVDEEVVRRGPERMQPERYIRTLIRLERTDEALATMPLLAGRPHAEEWQKHFGKLAEDLAFEKEIARQAAPLIASGKSGAQLHEEALALHKQKKLVECLPYYQAAVTLSPDSGRYPGNYACAVMVEHEFFGQKLARRAIALDRGRGHSYLMLSDALLGSNSAVGAYLLAKEALRLGWKDTFTWSKIARSADMLRERKEAEAAAREALKLDPNNPELKYLSFYGQGGL